MACHMQKAAYRMLTTAEPLVRIIHEVKGSKIGKTGNALCSTGTWVSGKPSRWYKVFSNWGSESYADGRWLVASMAARSSRTARCCVRSAIIRRGTPPVMRRIVRKRETLNRGRS